MDSAAVQTSMDILAEAVGLRGDQADTSPVSQARRLRIIAAVVQHRLGRYHAVARKLANVRRQAAQYRRWQDFHQFTKFQEQIADLRQQLDEVTAQAKDWHESYHELLRKYQELRSTKDGNAQSD